MAMVLCKCQILDNRLWWPDDLTSANSDLVFISASEAPIFADMNPSFLYRIQLIGAEVFDDSTLFSVVTSSRSIPSNIVYFTGRRFLACGRLVFFPSLNRVHPLRYEAVDWISWADIHLAERRRSI